MSKLNLGASAPSFTLPGTDGQQHSLSDYAAKNATVVIFSCNHCPYVRAWEDRMVQTQADYGAKGVQLIAINANNAVSHPSDSFDKMKERVAEKGFNFPYLHDESQEVARAYGAERTPEVFVFDKDHKLSYHGAIDDNYDNPSEVKQHYLSAALDAILAGQSPSVSETAPVGCTIKWK